MAVSKDPITPAEVNRSFVLQKCDYFLDVQLWPLRQKLNPERWLENFNEGEQQHAIHLLNAFTYFPEPLVDQLYTSSFQSLSRLLRRKGEPFISTQRAWQSFNDRLIVTLVTGEIPSITDSSYNFTRKAKQLLGIDEDRILNPEGTLKELVDQGTSPVVFVDDFVGSGEQFEETWHREYKLSPTISKSFSDLSKTSGGKFYYCPVVCTEIGLQHIQKTCPEVQVLPAHVLGPKYGVDHPESIVWPVHLRPAANAFIVDASARAEIPAANTFGYKRLGLTLAFYHGIPDATLPLFTANHNGWKPLVKYS